MELHEISLEFALDVAANPEAYTEQLREKGASPDEIRGVVELCLDRVKLDREIREELNRPQPEIDPEVIPYHLRTLDEFPDGAGTRRDGVRAVIYGIIGVGCCLSVAVMPPRFGISRLMLLTAALVSSGNSLVLSKKYEKYEEAVAPYQWAKEQRRERSAQIILANEFGELDAPLEIPDQPPSGIPPQPSLPQPEIPDQPTPSPNPSEIPPQPPRLPQEAAFGRPLPQAQNPTQARDYPELSDVWLGAGVGHTIIAGEESSGKACTALALVEAITQADTSAPGVEVFAYDPTEGGEHNTHGVWTRAGVPSTSDSFEMLDLVESLAEYLDDRPLRNNREAFAAQPRFVLIIDELSTCLLALDKDEEKRFTDAIRRLFTAGGKRKVTLFFLNQDLSIGSTSGMFSQAQRSNFRVICLNKQIDAALSANALRIQIERARNLGPYLHDNKGKYQSVVIVSDQGAYTAAPAKHPTHHGVSLKAGGASETPAPSRWINPPNLAPPSLWLPPAIAGHYQFFYEWQEQGGGDPVATREEEPEDPRLTQFRLATQQQIAAGMSQEDIMESWGDLPQDQKSALWECCTQVQ